MIAYRVLGRSGLGCCTFLGGGSVVDWDSVFVPCFVVHCFVSLLVLQSS